MRIICVFSNQLVVIDKICITVLFKYGRQVKGAVLDLCTCKFRTKPMLAIMFGSCLFGIDANHLYVFNIQYVEIFMKYFLCITVL